MKRRYYEFLLNYASISGILAGTIMVVADMPVPSIFITMGVVFGMVFMTLFAFTEPPKSRRRRAVIVDLDGSGKSWKANVRR